MRDERRIRILAWVVGLAVAGWQAWLTRQQLSSDDAIAYLDIGDAYVRGDWTNAINAYWSPLYSWILGAVIRVVGPSPAWEFPLVKAVNLVLFVFAFLAFEAFWRRLMTFACGFNDTALPRWMMAALGYGAFLWTSLTFIGVSSDTPDMLVAACTYLGAALIMQLRTRPTAANAAAFGAVLGLGFLAKAALFPMAFVFLFVAAIATRHIRAFVIAAATFLVFAAPFIGAISSAKGRLTFGDTGRLNYAWSMTRDVRPFRFWHKAATHVGAPVHPPRVLSTRPEVFEFAQPIGGTYPPWHDPSYWYEGLEVRVRPAFLVVIAAANAGFYAMMFGAWIVVGWIGLVGVRNLRESVRDVGRAWAVIAPAVCGLGLYVFAADLRSVTLPTQPSTRFIAAFVVLLIGGLAASLRGGTATLRRCTVTVSATVALMTGSLLWNTAQRLRASSGAEATLARDQVGVADTLRSLGIKQGDRVAISGYYLFPYYHWARLDRVTITAEIFQADFFWEQTPERRDELIDAIRRSGARAIVQRPGIKPPVGSAWRPIGHGYFMLPL
jgi:hypothetical protein